MPTTEFKASDIRYPKPFQLKDIAAYSATLKARDVKKYDELRPILWAEGRRPAPKKRTRGIQAGEEDFSDDEEYKGLGRLNREYQMVIQDWGKSPIFSIIQRGTDDLKAILKYCNKATLNRLAGDLRERKEYEERTVIRARRER